MQTQDATITNPAEKTAKLTDKQLAYKLLRDQGLSIKDAAKSMEYSIGTAYHLEKKVREYRIKGNEKLIRKAHKALNNLVAGKRFGELKEVKDSTCLAAAKEILDREEPVIKQSVNLNLNADISPVDLSRYRRDTMTNVNEPGDMQDSTIDISATYRTDNNRVNVTEDPLTDTHAQAQAEADLLDMPSSSSRLAPMMDDDEDGQGRGGGGGG